MSLLARQNTAQSHSPIHILPLILGALGILVVFAKYISPILYYISERLAGAPIDDVPVMWDFWWPLYFVIASLIYSRARRSWLLFLSLAVARILWGAIVLTLFFARSEWGFWNLQWLFTEVLTVMGMAGGAALALSPAGRDEMITRSRTVSIPA